MVPSRFCERLKMEQWLVKKWRGLIKALVRSQPKALTLFLVVFIFYREWRCGHFEKMGSQLRTLKPFSIVQPLLLFGTLAACMLFGDPVLLHRIQTLEHPFFIFVSDFGGFLGRSTNLWMVLAGWYGLSVWVKRPGGSQLAFGCFLSSVLTSLLCLALKFTFLRARPDAGLGHLSFFHLEGLLKDEGIFQSFPSGDVSVVAGSAAFLFYSLKSTYGRWPVLLLPFATAFSRINGNRHWPSDTLFSMGLGLACAKLIWDLRKEIRVSDGN